MDQPPHSARVLLACNTFISKYPPMFGEFPLSVVPGPVPYLHAATVLLSENVQASVVAPFQIIDVKCPTYPPFELV